MILFPILAAIIFNTAIGGNINNVNIAVQNEEIINCQKTAISGCLYENNNSIHLSCEILNGLRSLKYNLVKLKKKKNCI